MKSLDKNKPKELDWSWIKLDKPLGVIVNQGMDRPFLVYGFNLFKQRVNLEVNNLLTQQRTELLEGIKGLKMEKIYSNVFGRYNGENKLIDEFNHSIDKVINLLNKK